MSEKNIEFFLLHIKALRPKHAVELFPDVGGGPLEENIGPKYCS